MFEPARGRARLMRMNSANRSEIETALNELLPRLWRFAFSLCGKHDVAEDLVQSTCLRMLTRSDQYRVGTHVDRWGFTILLNLWRSEGRRAQPVYIEDAAPDQEFAECPERSPERVVYLRQVLSALDRLSEDHRSILLLIYGEGFTYKETAELLDVPIGTVMSRAHAARGAMAKIAVFEG